jgi:hypothetical protein
MSELTLDENVNSIGILEISWIVINVPIHNYSNMASHIIEMREKNDSLVL